MIQNPDERLFKVIGELVGEYEDKGVFVNPHHSLTTALMHHSPQTFVILIWKLELKGRFALFFANNSC